MLEYGPGPHRDGLPESLEVRRVVRANRRLLNLRSLVQHQGQHHGEAVQQLLAALKHDGRNCHQVSLACSLVRGCHSADNLNFAITITETALTAARMHEREAKREKWHGWL